MSDEGRTVRCFMDGIDWQHHLDADSHGTRLYPSEETLRRHAKCIETGGCGVVEVEVRFIRWVEEQDLKWDHTNHAPDEMVEGKDEQS